MFVKKPNDTMTKLSLVEKMYQTIDILSAEVILTDIDKTHWTVYLLSICASKLLHEEFYVDWEFTLTSSLVQCTIQPSLPAEKIYIHALEVIWESRYRL